MSSQENAIIAETIIQGVLSVGFLLLYIKRINKLDKMASNHNQTKSKTLVPKLILIGLLIIFEILHIVLSFTLSTYWLYPYSTFSLVSLVLILNYLLQCYIIVSEFKKKARRSKTLLAQWILFALYDISLIVCVEVFAPSTSITLIIFKTIDQIVLVIISAWLEDNKIQSPIIDNSNLLPLIQGKSTIRTQNNIYIEFNKDFDIVLLGNGIQVTFKIAVYVGDQSSIIIKNQDHFIQLRKQLLQKFPNDQLLKFSNFQDRRTSNTKSLMKYGQERHKICENFLIDLTRDHKYYIQILLDFLGITKNKKQLLIQNQNKARLSKKQSIISQQDNHHAISQPFFKVQWQQNKIHVYNQQILEIIVDKSHKQIQKFYNKIADQHKLRTQLPQALLQSDILQFISRIANSKHLWRQFSQWLCLGMKLQDKIYNMFDFWYYGFKNLTLSIIGHQIVFDRQGSIHTLYLLSLTRNNFIDPNKKSQGKTLKKRFNEFIRLDKHIKKFLASKHIKYNLPDLPPKFSPFGSKTSPKSRQIYFDIYIKQLVKIEEINHCVKFLEFLEIDSSEIPLDLYPQAQQSFNQQLIASLCIDTIHPQRG